MEAALLLKSLMMPGLVYGSVRHIKCFIVEAGAAEVGSLEMTAWPW